MPKLVIPKKPRATGYNPVPAQVPPWRTPPLVTPDGDPWVGSVPEWAVYWAFLELKYVPKVDFFHQSPINGGRLFAGGAMLDFEVPALNIGIRVQGLLWHYGRGQETIAKDMFQRVELESLGVTIVDIDEDAALEMPLPLVKDALLGIDRSRSHVKR